MSHTVYTQCAVASVQTFCSAEVVSMRKMNGRGNLVLNFILLGISSLR